MYSKANETEEFTESELKQKWLEYLLKLVDRPNLRSTLSEVPKLEKDFSLVLKIDNRIQDELIGSIKPDLVSWLRKELKNSKIVLNTIITETNKAKVVYTDEEKYREMVKKNPQLAQLKKKFNLDF
ncbi:MAG: hypothetical protein ABFS16_09765 [Bacteroidota bacterium]